MGFWLRVCKQVICGLSQEGGQSTHSQPGERTVTHPQLGGRTVNTPMPGGKNSRIPMAKRKTVSHTHSQLRA